MVNAGNANVFTGKAGRKAVEDTADAAAKALDCPRDEIYVSSTGVIGEFLPAEKIVRRPARRHRPPRARMAGTPPARGIMTTDTFPKGSVRTARIDGTNVTLQGFCKGSGMIAPDMATMLAYVFTDAHPARPRVAGAAYARRRPVLQRHHGRRRHLHQRHGAFRGDGQGGACAGRERRRPAAARFPAAARRFAARSREAGGARRRGRGKAGGNPHHRRRFGQAPGISASWSAIRRW